MHGATEEKRERESIEDGIPQQMKTSAATLVWTGIISLVILALLQVVEAIRGCFR